MVSKLESFCLCRGECQSTVKLVDLVPLTLMRFGHVMYRTIDENEESDNSFRVELQDSVLTLFSSYIKYIYIYI